MTKTKIELFWEWVEKERSDRGLSYSAIERLGGVANAVVSKKASNLMVPTLETCKAIAKAFKVKDTEVLARAGLIDPIPPTDTPNIRKMIEKFSRLSDEDQIYMLRVISGLEKEEQASQTNNHVLRPAKP